MSEVESRRALYSRAIAAMPNYGSSTDRSAQQQKPTLGDRPPSEQQKSVSVAQAGQALPVEDTHPAKIADGDVSQRQPVSVVGHSAEDTNYRIALVAAECSSLICDHGIRLGLDAFAAATIARAVHNRILEMADVR